MPLNSKWKRNQPSTVYENNYNCGINYYQPMIDYIDQKNRKIVKDPQYPEMPWADERFLWERKRVLPYTADELIQHAIEAEEHAKDHLSHFKIAKRSDFSLKKAVEATHVTKEILPTNIEETTKSKRNERPIPLDVTMADLMVQTVRNNEKMKHVKQALEHSVRLRGKSARAIEFELRAESAKNLSGTTELADIRKYQREAMQAMWDERDHVRMMEDRTKLLKDEEIRLTAPLDDLSQELKELEIKSSNYFIDKR
ncbi:paramyosin, short form-like [Microplitis demolitor]|uniref:paramyosin, short form-like n=1 Tax=Microplitis demolitor TaxID=69319 RepID=UPI00235B60C3|nr:paramyosin, short form-like [Microplitis demolitor]